MKKKIRKPRDIKLEWGNEVKYVKNMVFSDRIIIYNIDEGFVIFPAKEARRLARWLFKISDYLEQKERER